MQEPELSIIVPVFNEAENIVANLDLLISEVESSFKSFEIIVVSDGSSDGTNIKVYGYNHPNLKLKSLEQNKGKGHAVRSGFKEANGAFICFIDGGMELHPKELKIFLGLIKLYQADIIIGSKRHPQSEIYYPWYRKLLSFVFQILVRILFKINVTDSQVGLKMFRREVIRSILPYLKIDRYGFDLEILCLASALGYTKILEAPIKLDYFLKNDRALVKDISHVLKVGLSLVKETASLYLRFRQIVKEKRV